jgi:hypothetical protein
MTIEGRSNVVPMMTLLAISFRLEKRHKPIISILDYHVKAIVAKSRDTQHIPRIDWVCAFFIPNLTVVQKSFKSGLPLTC